MPLFTSDGRRDYLSSSARIAPLVKSIALSYPRDPTKIQYGMRLERASNLFPTARRIHHLGKEAFRGQALALEAELERDPDTKYLRDLPHFSVYVPRMKVGGHYNTILKQFLLPPLQALYTNMFLSSDRSFRCTLDTQHRILVSPKTRHQRVLDRITEQPLVCLYFPCQSLRGFPIQAAQDQAASLPSKFAVAGLLETIMLFLLYPEFVATDTGLTIMTSGVYIGTNPETTIYVSPQAKHLEIGQTARTHFTQGCDLHSSGLLYFGLKSI